jgi:hypothetical protein
MSVKAIIRRKIDTKKINIWFKKNGGKVAKLVLAGVISVPVLILLTKFLKHGTLNTVEKKTIVSFTKKVDNIPVIAGKPNTLPDRVIKTTGNNIMYADIYDRKKTNHPNPSAKSRRFSSDF